MSACLDEQNQDVYPTGPGNTVEGYRAACSCGWRTDVLPSRGAAVYLGRDHVGISYCDRCEQAPIKLAIGKFCEDHMQNHQR